MEYPHIPRQALTNFDELRKRLQNLNHRNVMKYKHAWIDELGDRVVFITNWTSSGNLAQFVVVLLSYIYVIDILQKQDRN